MGCTMSQEEIFSQTNQQNIQGMESKFVTKASLLIIYDNEPDDIIMLWSKVAESMAYEVHLVSINYETLFAQLSAEEEDSSFSADYYQSLQIKMTANIQMVHEALHRKLTGLHFEIVMIDMRNLKYENLATSICQYFRTQSQYNLDLIVVSLISKNHNILKNPNNSIPFKVISNCFNKYFVATTNLSSIVRELLIFMCNELVLVRRLRASQSYSLSQKHLQTIASNENISWATDSKYNSSPIQYNSVVLNEKVRSKNDIDDSKANTSALPSSSNPENPLLYERLSDFMQDFKEVAGDLKGNKKWTISFINKMSSYAISEREVKNRLLKSIRRPKRLRGSSSIDAEQEKSHIMGKRKESWARLKENDPENDSTLHHVIKMLQDAQISCGPATSREIQNVLDILLTNDLFCGILKADRSCSKNKDDFISALMTSFDNHKSQSGSVTKPKQMEMAIKLDEIPEHIEKALENDNSWDFDVINLERVSENRPLFYLGMKIFAKFGIVSFLKCSQNTANSWLSLMESNYHSKNAYHNSTHAADVMQSCSYLLQKESIKDYLSQEDFAVTIISAIAHDVDHPGKTNQFLVMTRNNLALLYNDIAVLENHHASFAFRLTFQHEDCNIFANLDSATLKSVRNQIVSLILATELSAHYNHLQQFIAALSQPMIRKYSSTKNMESTEIDTIDDNSLLREVFLKDLLTSEENRMILKRMIVKCSDVNNPTRNRKLCLMWAERIANEYFDQMDEEIELGFDPISMPPFNRKTCNLATTQVRFFEFFLMKMIPALDSVVNCPELIENFDSNLNYWRKEAEATERTV